MHDVNWSTLQHAYGRADDIPAMLAKAERTNSTSDQIWDDLWGRLCHQDTVYTASYPALPSLARAAANLMGATFNPALALGAFIVASDDAPADADHRRALYAVEIAELERIAVASLGAATSDQDFAYVLTEVTCLRRDQHRNSVLALAAGERNDVECPSCGDTYDVDLHSTFAVTEWDSDVGLTTVQPIDPDQLNRTEQWVLQASDDHGRTEIRHRLLHALGTFDCPRCRTMIDLLLP